MTQVIVPITENADDGRWFELGQFSINAITCGHNFGAEFSAFFRFLEVSVPQGVRIDTATLSLNITTASSPDCHVYGVDVDNAASFSNPENLPPDAPRTTASTRFQPSSGGIFDIDITAQIQEIIDRVGWVSGNNLALVALNNSEEEGTHLWNAEDFSTGGEHVATLTINWSFPPISAGVVYRYVDANNYWRAFADAANGQIVLEKVVGGVATEVAWVEVSLGSAGEIRAIAQGDRHRVWWDYHLVIDVEDSDLNTATLAGLYSAKTQSVSFRDWYAQGL